MTKTPLRLFLTFCIFWLNPTNPSATKNQITIANSRLFNSIQSFLIIAKVNTLQITDLKQPWKYYFLVFLLTLPCFTYAASDENIMKQATKLNNLCSGGSGDNSANRKACDKWDNLVDELTSKNWWYGHEGDSWVSGYAGEARNSKICKTIKII